MFMSAGAGESVSVMIGVNYLGKSFEPRRTCNSPVSSIASIGRSPRAIQAATGANRSRPWKELDKLGGRQTIRRVRVFVARPQPRTGDRCPALHTICCPLEGSRHRDRCQRPDRSRTRKQCPLETGSAMRPVDGRPLGTWKFGTLWSRSMMTTPAGRCPSSGLDLPHVDVVGSDVSE